VVVVVWWWWFGGGGVVVVFLTDNNTSPTTVVLICFGLLVGLWQQHLFSNCRFSFLTDDSPTFIVEHKERSIAGTLIPSYV
jgi:hypothetical protein